MKIEIRVTDENGLITEYSATGSLHQLVWDGFLTAQYQDEQWHEEDTCDLIISKLKGESPVQYALYTKDAIRKL